MSFGLEEGLSKFEENESREQTFCGNRVPAKNNAKKCILVFKMLSRLL